MAACSATMATSHIRMLLYDMTYLGMNPLNAYQPFHPAHG
jgi:hypothetical protein